jgi:hypothetical protein
MYSLSSFPSFHCSATSSSYPTILH